MPKTIPAVMIVDDFEPDVVYAKLVLTESGLVDFIYEANSAREALSLFAHAERTRAKYPGRFPPNVLLLDINMPGCDGFEFLQAYEEDILPELRMQGDTEASIFMVTSSNAPPDIAKAKNFRSVKDYLVKPLEEGHVQQIATTCAAL